jgi:hypothetical protein
MGEPRSDLSGYGQQNEKKQPLGLSLARFWLKSTDRDVGCVSLSFAENFAIFGEIC